MCSKDVKRISGRLAIFIRLEAKPLVLRWKLQHVPWLQLPYHWAFLQLCFDGSSLSDLTPQFCIAPSGNLASELLKSLEVEQKSVRLLGLSFLNPVTGTFLAPWGVSVIKES